MSTPITFSLHQSWTVQTERWDTPVKATVPGDLYSDLLAAGKMEDPYYRDNELAALPLSDADYDYETTFAVDTDAFAKEFQTLRFEGVDTLADIFLNGEKLASVNNMHRTYEFDVKALLRPAGNTLRVHFFSPTKYIKARYEAKILDGTSDAMRGFPYLRKAHYMFGWDWGPRLPGCGLFRPVTLISYDVARLDSVLVTQKHENGAVTLHVRPALSGTEETPEEAGLTARTEVLSPDGDVVASGEDTLVIQDPMLWYPAGYGGQPLYTVRVTLLRGDEVLDVWERKLGLRTMTMTREKDEWGESFCHTVNGVKIFAMGGDYIPEDNLIARTNQERTKRLLRDARAANFNCIRVWGGGYYPEDWFYDLCDELGLIVWQDFMFACAVYELTEEFEENIRAELIDNIKRLRHHASLGLWCGNNEMETFVQQGTWVNSPREVSDYVKMYEYLFPKLVKQYDPQTFYWKASPSSGGDFDEPNDENRGDVHYWEVWHGDKPFTEYRKFYFRYLSEFGFQSFPAVKTIGTFTEASDRNVYSYVMEKHQRNAAANGKIASYMGQTYLYPTDFATFVYASQLLQATAIKYGVEHLRRHRGRCMGAVIWQLNDCWPVASWSSIDYCGRWKALHYYARRFFAPVLLSCEEESILTQDTNPNAEPYEVKKSVRFNVSNETMTEENVTVRWSLRDPYGTVLSEETEELYAPALSAVWGEKTDLPDAKLYDAHVYYELLSDGAVTSSGSVLFCPPKYYHFTDPHLTYRVENDELVVLSSAYAKDVEIQNENEDLVLSDNYFDLEPGEKRVRILRGEPLAITLRSTYDIR